MDEGSYREAEDRFWEWAKLERTERFFDLPVTGTRVRVQEHGSGPDVLFIHGAPNSGSTWVPLLGSMRGFRCLLVDRPGTGLSEDFTLERDRIPAFAERFCPELMDALGLERAHVVASSMGGYLALVAAKREPKRFERMVQMACPALVPAMKLPTMMRVLSIGPVRRAMNSMPPNRRVGKQMLGQIGHRASIAAGRMPEAFFDWYLALQRDTNTMSNDGELIGGAVSAIRGADPALELSAADLAAVPTPTLYLWGEDDAFGGAEVAESVVAAQADADLEMLPESGHLPWLDYPERIGERATAFLNE